jgi:hypothetical protein
MLRRATRVLIAFVVALAVTMRIGVRAMPMTTAPDGTATEQPCQNCPQPDQTGNMNPDKMPACQALTCISVLAVLPTPTLVHGHILFRVVYLQISPARWAEAVPAPDPFPPRPIALF